MSRRRRGNDFTQLLESFRNTTDCGSDLDPESGVSSVAGNRRNDATYDGNRRVASKSSMDDETSGTCSFKSTILAGHAVDSESQGSTENSYQTARSGSIVGGYGSCEVSVDAWRTEVPSEMNRAIDIRFEPESDLDLTHSASDTRMSGKLNRNIDPSEKPISDGRDSNYNIRNEMEEEASAAVVAEKTCGGLKSTECMPNHQSTPEAKDLHNEWSILSRLDNVLDPLGCKTNKSKKKILKRLSQEFMFSPRTFHERLVTIIDESETEHALAAGDTTGVNISRMTKEFREMCKYIQDESFPEWAPSVSVSSIPGSPKYPKLGKSQIPATIRESPTASSSSDFPSPQYDETAVRKIYRKTPLNIFKKTFGGNKIAGSPGSPNSTKHFEDLEKDIEASCSPKSRTGNLRRSVSTSDISEPSRERLTIKCEELLRSLDDTTPLEFDTFDSHRGRRAEEPEIEKLSTNIQDDDRYTDARTAEEPKDVATDEINEDELSSSLLIELREQRQRCLDTAKAMQEIEKDAKNQNEDYSEELNRRGIDPGAEFLKTISTCFAYQKCRAGLRQIEKRSEASSADSGIDSRSISRTIRGSSKKNCYNGTPRESTTHRRNQTPAKNFNKLSRYGLAPVDNKKSDGLLSAHWNSTRVGTSTLKKTDTGLGTASRVQQKTPRKNDKPICNPSPRKKSPAFLCARNSFGRSRSPSIENRSPARQVPTKSRYFITPLTKRVDEKRDKLSVPEINVFSTSSELITVSDSESRGSSVGKKSPRPKSRTPQSASRRPISPMGNRLHRPTRTTPAKAKTTTYTTEKRAESPASSKTVSSPRRKFFVTPGKSVPVVQKKRTLFTNPSRDLNKESSPVVTRSLHAPGIYRLGYQTVISPVSMYIHGTDVNLIQNKPERKNEMMLTPSKAATSEEKLKYKLSKASNPRDSPRKNRFLADYGDTDSQSGANDENVEKPHLALPKANYNLPAQVHTVNESPKYDRYARTRGLLQSTQNRVVIHHEGKRFGKPGDDVPESGSDSPEMSIHVLKSAVKTSCMNHRK